MYIYIWVNTCKYHMPTPWISESSTKSASAKTQQTHNGCVVCGTFGICQFWSQSCSNCWANLANFWSDAKTAAVMLGGARYSKATKACTGALRNLFGQEEECWHCCRFFQFCFKSTSLRGAVLLPWEFLVQFLRMEWKRYEWEEPSSYSNKFRNSKP